MIVIDQYNIVQVFTSSGSYNSVVEALFPDAPASGG